MANTYQKWIGAVRVTHDIELKYTGAGKAVTNIKFACDYGWGENKTTLWGHGCCMGQDCRVLRPVHWQG